MGFPALQKEWCRREAPTVVVFSLMCTDLYKQQGLQETLQCRGWFPALPLRSAGPSCTSHLLQGFVAWLCWADFLIYQTLHRGCLPDAAWEGTCPPALHSGRKPPRGESPLSQHKVISQPHRPSATMGIKGTHSVIQPERTHAPLQAFCHLCHCSKCDETILSARKINIYLDCVVCLAAKRILISLCGNSGF